MSKGKSRIAITGALALIGFGAIQVHAADLLGFYAGAAIARGYVDQVQFNVAQIPTTVRVRGFDVDTSFKVMVGLRPIQYLGAEVAYVDFGTAEPRYKHYLDDQTLKLKGFAATGIVYLPLPWIDLYGKAGVSRLAGTPRQWINCVPRPNVNCGVAGPFYYEIKDAEAGFVGGLGAQLKVGALAVRLEYERFSAFGGHPSLSSLGAIWSF